MHPPPPRLTKNPGSSHALLVQMSLLVCVDAVLEKVEFDLLTPSPGSGEVGEGDRRGESQQFFLHVRASLTLLGELS